MHKTNDKYDLNALFNAYRETRSMEARAAFIQGVEEVYTWNYVKVRRPSVSAYVCEEIADATKDRIYRKLFDNPNVVHKNFSSYTACVFRSVCSDVLRRRAREDVVQMQEDSEDGSAMDAISMCATDTTDGDQIEIHEKALASRAICKAVCSEMKADKSLHMKVFSLYMIGVVCARTLPHAEQNKYTEKGIASTTGLNMNTIATIVRRKKAFFAKKYGFAAMSAGLIGDRDA